MKLTRRDCLRLLICSCIDEISLSYGGFHLERFFIQNYYVSHGPFLYGSAILQAYGLCRQ